MAENLQLLFLLLASTNFYLLLKNLETAIWFIRSSTCINSLHSKRITRKLLEAIRKKVLDPISDLDFLNND